MCYIVWELFSGNRVMRMKDENEATPVVQAETLIYWQDGQDHRLPVGTPAWYTWLSTARSFAFRSALGSFTARREPASNKRGGEYWRAYPTATHVAHRARARGRCGLYPARCICWDALPSRRGMQQGHVPHSERA